MFTFSYFILKNMAYKIGMNMRVMSVPTNRPPMMVTARLPNMASGMSGIMPRMVVSDAIITGRNRLFELLTNAALGYMPSLICRLISSMSTITFLIIMPIRPSTPTMATKPKGLPVISTAGITPTKMSGMQQKMMAGFL